MTISSTNVRTLRKLVRHGALGHAARMVENRQPSDVADMMTGFAVPEAARLARALVSSGRAAPTLRELPPSVLRSILNGLHEDELLQLIGAHSLDPTQAAFFWDFLDDERRDCLLHRLPAPRREALDQLNRYPEDSAGALMCPRVLALGENTTAQEALESVRAPQKDEAPFYLYVVDEESRLTGVVSLRQLVLCSPGVLLKQIMVCEPVRVTATASKGELAALVSQHNFLSVPVVDHSGRLLGAVTVDCLIDCLPGSWPRESASFEERKDSAAERVSRLDAEKAPLHWTLLQAGTALAAGLMLLFFWGAMAKFAALIAFLPLVAALTGASGGRSSSAVLRALSGGELPPRRGWWAVMRMVLSWLLVGGGIGLISALIVFLWASDPRLALVVCLAMAVTLGLAALVGAGVPLLLKHFRRDPQLGSTLWVAGLTDGLGYLTFLGLASLFFLLLQR